jgi:hypothetical protein
VADLAASLAQIPREATLVVFHSAVLAYVSKDERQSFAAALAAESHRRTVVWLSNEAPGVLAEMSALAPTAQTPSQGSALGEARFLLGRTRFSRGDRSDELLGLAHPHGAELEWLQPP